MLADYSCDPTLARADVRSVLVEAAREGDDPNLVAKAKWALRDQSLTAAGRRVMAISLRGEIEAARQALEEIAPPS